MTLTSKRRRQIGELYDRMNAEATRLKAEQQHSMTPVDDAQFFAMLAEADRLEAEEKKAEEEGHDDPTAVQ